MDDHISTPVKADVLRVVLEHWIEGLQSLQEGGEEEVLRDLVEMFLEDGEDRLKKMRAAVREEDAQRLSQEADALKGSSGNMGATGMSRLSSELESVGESEDLVQAHALLDALEEEFGRVRPALQVTLRQK